MRGNCDFIFLMWNDWFKERTWYYEQFGGVFEKKEHFLQTFMTLTDNYGCMVINNLWWWCKISDRIYFFRAED